MTMLASSCGTHLALHAAMSTQPSLENRVQVLEEKVTTLEELPAHIDAAFTRFAKEMDAKLETRFMAEGEMMDERFAEVYAYMDKRFAQVYTYMDKRFDTVDEGLKILREGMKVVIQKLG